MIPVAETTLPMSEFAITFAKTVVIEKSCEYDTGQVVASRYGMGKLIN